MHFKKFTTFKAFGSMCLSRGKEIVNEFELIISQEQVEPVVTVSKFEVLQLPFPHVDPGSDIASTLPTSDDRCLVDDKYTISLVGNSLEGRETFIENPISHLQGLMIRDSVREFGTNIVRYYETYKPEDIGTVKAAWNRLFTQEAILCVSYSEELEP